MKKPAGKSGKSRAELQPHPMIDGVDLWIDENFNELYSQQVKTGDIWLRKRLIGAHIGYAFAIADLIYRRINGSRGTNNGTDARILERDDLRNWGVLGLEDAYDHYNLKFMGEESVPRFKPYAAWWIKQEIFRGVHQMHEDMRKSSYNNSSIMGVVENEIILFFSEHGRKPTIEEIASRMGKPAGKIKVLLNQSYEFVYLDSEGPDGESVSESIEDPKSDYLEVEVNIAARQVLDGVSKDERKILEWRNGFYGERKTFREIEEQTGIDYRILERNHKELLKKIRKKFDLVRRDRL